MSNAEITKVTVRWDDQCGVEPGWYCESYADGEFIDDSQKVWFPVRVDTFHRYEGPQLRAALTNAFPNAEIVME